MCLLCAAALYDAIAFFKPLCGASQPAWIRVADRVTAEVVSKSDDPTWQVDSTACHLRFKWFQSQVDPTGGAESPDPVKRLIGPMKELQAHLDYLQVSYFDDCCTFQIIKCLACLGLQGARRPGLKGLKDSGPGSDYSKSVPPPPKAAMVKHHEIRGPPGEKRGAPHKNQNEHASSILTAIAALGHGAGSGSSAALAKEASEATIARRNALKQKLDMLVAARALDATAVPEAVINAARDAWIADLLAPEPADSEDDAASSAGKRKREGGQKPADGMVPVAPAKHSASPATSTSDSK